MLSPRKEFQMTYIKITKGSANVFADLGFGPQESQNLLLRSQTMIALVQWFNASGLTQAAAAKTLGVTQPRLNQLLKGKIEIFSLDALVNMATSAGMRVGLSIRPKTSVKVRTAAPAKIAQPSKQGLRAAG
jgi:predicted XRE-type DNA-binding protein